MSGCEVTRRSRKSPGGFAALAAIALIASSCAGPFQEIPDYHEQKLPSGKTVKILLFSLAWGSDHDARIPSQDSFTLYYVSNVAEDDSVAMQEEAREVFELIRPTSELWGFDTVSITSRPTLEWKGEMAIWTFKRAADGDWTIERFH